MDPYRIRYFFAWRNLVKVTIVPTKWFYMSTSRLYTDQKKKRPFMWIVSKRLQSFRSVILLPRSVRVAERLALPTSDHGVAGSNPAGGEILPEPKRRFTAQSLSCSPFHRLEMTEILLKGRKTLTHPSIFCFKKYDYLTVLCSKKKFIRWTFIRCTVTTKTTPQAPIPPITKVTKSINISRIFHLHYSPQRIPVSLNGHGPVAELL